MFDRTSVVYAGLTFVVGAVTAGMLAHVASAYENPFVARDPRTIHLDQGTHMDWAGFTGFVSEHTLISAWMFVVLPVVGWLVWCDISTMFSKERDRRRGPPPTPF